MKKQIAHLIEENDQLKKHNKGGNASKGTTGNKRSYNVRNFKGYPKTAKSSKKTKNRSSHQRPEPKIDVEKDADQTQCPQCGCVLSDPIETYSRVSEDLIDFKWTATRWTVTRRYCKNCDKQHTPTLDGVRPKEYFGVACHGPGGHNEVHEHLVWKDKVPHGDILWCRCIKGNPEPFLRCGRKCVLSRCMKI